MGDLLLVTFVVVCRADADEEGGKEELPSRGGNSAARAVDEIKQIGEKIGSTLRNVGAAAMAGLGADSMVLHGKVRATGR